MNKITDFGKLGKAGFDQLRADIHAALKSVGEKHGIVLTTGNATHGGGYCDIKLRASVINELGVAETKEAALFRSFANIYGLKSTDLFKTFTMNKKTYKIIGMRNSEKTPIICEVEGKQYAVNAASVIEGLTINALQK